jgi:hypothetical protein
MKQLKKIGLVALAIAALTAIAGATNASATTFEIKGIKQSKALELTASLKAGSTLEISDTTGELGEIFSVTCSQSKINSATFGNPFTGTTLVHLISILQYSSCNEAIVVDKAGKLTFEAIAGTTNATVRWTESEVTLPSALGNMKCTTSNTDFGVLKGTASGQAILEVNAALSCAFFSTKWIATYVITSPEGLGVTA